MRRAEEAALEVAKQGYMPLCPHTNTRFFDGLLTPEFWLEGTQELLKRCDAVLVLEGWEQSEGTKEEIELAKELRMPIFYSTQSLRVARENAIFENKAWR